MDVWDTSAGQCVVMMQTRLEKVRVCGRMRVVINTCSVIWEGGKQLGAMPRASCYALYILQVTFSVQLAIAR